jgi:hypothetical protein
MNRRGWSNGCAIDGSIRPPAARRAIHRVGGDARVDAGPAALSPWERSTGGRIPLSRDLHGLSTVRVDVTTARGD